MELELQKWHKTDEEHKLVIAAAEKARDELERNCASLRADLEALRQSSATEKASLEARSVQLEREAHEQVESMRAQLDRDLQHMQQSHQEKVHDLSARLSSAQEDSKQAQADLESQLDKREKKLAEYHKKVRSRPPSPHTQTPN